MHQRNERTKKPMLPVIATVLIALTAGIISLSPPVHAKSADVAALERRVAELNRQLEQAKTDLVAARQEKNAAQEKAAKAEAELNSRGEPEPAKFKVGPVTVGGAMRVNYTQLIPDFRFFTNQRLRNSPSAKHAVLDGIFAGC